MGFIVRPPAWQMKQAAGASAGRPQLARSHAQFSRVQPGRLSLVARPKPLQTGRLSLINRPAALQTGRLALNARPAALQPGRLSFALPPTPWELQHAQGILAGQAYQAQTGGLLPDTPMWQMLEFRYSLNASRFTYFHPNVARMIEQKLTMPPPTTPPVTPPPVTPPPPTVVPPPTPPITPPPAIVIPPPTDPPPITPPVDPPPTDPPTDPPPGGQIVDPPGPGDNPGAVPEPSGFAMLLVAVVALGVFCFHAKFRNRNKGRRWFGLRASPSRSPIV